MAKAPTPRAPVRQGPSPEALAAFYRQRSEALRHNTTTTDDQAMQQQQQKTQTQQEQEGWFARLFHALGGGS